MRQIILLGVLFFLLVLLSCKDEGEKDPDPIQKVFYTTDQFCMGADLSYINQILDHGGTYRDSGEVKDPYLIFRNNGANVVRFRLFHTPTWTKEIYGGEGTQFYHEYNDVKLGIERAKSAGFQVCLDFHYSDTWADPGHQVPPAAWESLDLEQMHDSIYAYTFTIVANLDTAGLMPEYVQIGNEINPGFVLPLGKRWEGNQNNCANLLNAGIQAVRDASVNSSIDPEVIIHIAQPENVDGWFNGMKAAGLTDYDIIGISYYYQWSTVPLENVSNYISSMRIKYEKEIMIVETVYPWTTGYFDNYNNIINIEKLVPGYPATEEGQYNYLVKLTQEIIDGGGKGIFPWEPAWISSDMKTQWGEGSAWECNTLFDFQGNVIKGMHYMTYPYEF
jgi:arabinogalactan endo-1,4-beta-galactosidase